MKRGKLLRSVTGSVALTWLAAVIGGGAPAAGQDLPRVGDQPFTLTASSLVLTGAVYHGIVDVPTRHGSRTALHFTATGSRITDLVQTARLGGGHTLTLSAEPGSTSVAEDGTIDLYTERLAGRLAGIPVEFTPDSPPPLALPAMRFTDVTVENAAMRGGTLRIPEVHVELHRAPSPGRRAPGR